MALLPKYMSGGVEFTRPADTTAYAANDAVSNSTAAPVALSLILARWAGSSGIIRKVRLTTDQVTNTAQYRVHVFIAAPTPINDNAAFPLLYADVASRIGSVDIPALASGGAGSNCAAGQNTATNLPFALASANQTLYFLVETLSIFTPASGQKIYLDVTVEADSLAGN